MVTTIKNNKFSAGIIAAGLTVVILVMIFPILGVVLNGANAENNDKTPADYPDTLADCTASYAYTAYSGTGNRFGPEQNFETVEQARARFDQKMNPCGGDPLYAAGVFEFIEHGENMSDVAAEQRAATYVADPTTWQQDVEKVYGEIVGYKLVHKDVKYSTLGMVVGSDASVMPDLVKFESKQTLGAALELELKNGEKLLLRGICDLQPSVTKDFHEVPTPPTPPVENPPTDNPPTPVCPYNPALPPNHPDCVKPKDGRQSTAATGNNRPGGNGPTPTQTDSVGPPSGGQPPATYTPPVTPAAPPPQNSTPTPQPTNPPATGSNNGNNGGTVTQPDWP